MVATASAKQMEENTREVPTVGVEQPSMGVTSLTEAAKPMPGAVWPSVTTTPQTEVEKPTMGGS